MTADKTLGVSIFTAETGFGGVVADNDAVVEVILPFFTDHRALVERLRVQYGALSENRLSEKCGESLLRYFAGERVVMDFPLALKCTPFRLAVYEVVKTIPYGEVSTYAEVAAAAGSPGAARAVGGVMATNLQPVLVPCHRGVGAGGKLTGFSAEGGVASKKWLLDLERRHANFSEKNALSRKKYGNLCT